MLQAVIFHSDNLVPGEQRHGTAGYQKSLSNLSGSYASLLAAAHARHATSEPVSAQD
jgi:glucoamylase